jgi:hypothetical protein
VASLNSPLQHLADVQRHNPLPYLGVGLDHWVSNLLQLLVFQTFAFAFALVFVM